MSLVLDQLPPQLRDGVEQANFSGTVEGRLVDALSGSGGFGYDPLFIPEGYGQTFAELGDAVKNTLSHRARALGQVIAYLARQGTK